MASRMQDGWLIRPGLGIIGGKSDEMVQGAREIPTLPDRDVLVVHTRSSRPTFGMLVTGRGEQRVVSVTVEQAARFVRALEQIGCYTRSKPLLLVACMAGLPTHGQLPLGQQLALAINREVWACQSYGFPYEDDWLYHSRPFIRFTPPGWDS